VRGRVHTPEQRHLASTPLFPIFGMKIYIDSQNRIALTRQVLSHIHTFDESSIPFYSTSNGIKNKIKRARVSTSSDFKNILLPFKKLLSV